MRTYAIALGLLTTTAVALACSSSTVTPGSADGGDAGSGSGSGSGSDGSTGEGGIPPDAFIAATLGVGPSSPSTVCNVGSTRSELSVGVAINNSRPATVADGDQQAGSTVHVSCAVVASGGGFDIALEVSTDGPAGGDVTILSPGGAGAVTLSGASGITGTFTRSDGTYSQSACTIAFTYLGGAVPGSPPVAAGRIWGHLSCPAAQASGETVPSPDGGVETVQCDAEADFLFEQCHQH